MSTTRAGIARIALLALAGCAGLAGCETSTSDKDIRNISVSELRDLARRADAGQKNLYLLIDPRSSAAFAAGRIPGAINMQLPQVDPRRGVDPALDRYENLVVYGNNPASAPARGMTKRLLSVGYDGVRLLAGGLEEWESLGYPVDRDPAP